MKKYIVAFIICFTTNLSAQSLSDQNQKALKNTQKLMRNQQKRNDFLKNNPAAQQAHDHATGLVGNDPAATHSLYDLSASVFEILVKETNGDPTKMNELLMKYQKNPAAFANKFTPEQRKKLRDISNKVGTSKSKP